MDSSVIFLVIVGLWAAVLLPYWVRRRTALGHSRARDRFSTAMHVLSRRPKRARASAPHSGYVHLPRARQPAARPATATARPARRAATSRAPQARAARPRVPLGGLVVLTLLVVLVLAFPASVVAVGLGHLPVWGPATVTSSLVLLVAVLRRRAVVRRARRRSAQRQVRGRAAVPAPTSAPRATAATTPDVPVGGGAADADGSVTAATEASEVSAAVPDDSWTPVPVPPPTYTLKPSAPPRQVPVGAPVRQSVPVTPPTRPSAPAAPAAPAASADPAPSAATGGSTWDLDAVLERRRAASG